MQPGGPSRRNMRLRPEMVASDDGLPLREGAARFHLGTGFFNPGARPARDLGVLLARVQAKRRPLRVLDLMAGCGLRSLRYGLEAQARSLFVNDADPARLPFSRANLAVLEGTCLLRQTAQKARFLLADCVLRGERFDLVDLDAFGSPHALVPMALEVVAFGGVLYLASTDGRGSTGHDRTAGLRHLGASARCHPASWELALRLQLGVIARAAWSQGRGMKPVFSFCDGRAFRTAVRLQRHPSPHEEGELGMLAVCHRCGDQQVQSLLTLNRWRPCFCGPAGLSALTVSGPLWIGPLQDICSLDAMAEEGQQHAISVSPLSERLRGRLRTDRGWPACSWSPGQIAKGIAGSQPPLPALVDGLREAGFQATANGVMPGYLRSDAPWNIILTVAGDLARAAAK
jgi:tRNA (guanine26-N2/guanine27-N2)-dimethyltransferase